MQMGISKRILKSIQDDSLRMEKLSRFLNHLRQGTLIDRIAWEWRKRVKQSRSRWWKSQAGKREYSDVKIDRGVRIRLHFDSELSRAIYVDDFERKEREFLKAYLRTGDLFVDVGANIGLFSLIAARVIGPTGKVFAFEPTGRIYERFTDSVRLNGFQNISCFRLALSDRVGRQDFFVSKDGFDAWNSFARPVAGRSFEQEPVECETWDRFALAHNLLGRVAMMKLDVEGWETRVLAGAAQTLGRTDAPLLQVEFTDAVAASAGSSCKDLYRVLQDFGYRMFIYDQKRRELIHDPLRESYPYANLIATKSPDAANLRLRKGTVW
jgi:FkbM family methyltransferase